MTPRIAVIALALGSYASTDAGPSEAFKTQMASAPHPVAIPSFDGVTLRGTYYDPGRPGPAVIIFRNCDRDRASSDSFASRLSALGIHALTWDYRSGLAANLDWRSTRLRDAEAVSAWLSAQAGVDTQRWVAIGGSCGVSLALDFAEHHVPALRGLVLLSGPSDPAQRAFVARTPGLAIFGGASQVEGAAVPSIDSIVKASSNPSTRLVTPENGGHGTEMLTQTADFAGSVVAWIASRLD